ncbi:MAG: serine hydrolase [Cyanobacteria bacterium J06554_6]
MRFVDLGRWGGGILLLGCLWLLPVLPLPAHPITATAQAATVTPETALSRLLTADELEAAWFADSFLAQISLAQIEQILRGITTSLGAYQSVEAAGEQYLLTFERGIVPTRIVLNSAGQITGLLFETPQLTNLTLDQLTERLTELPGEASLLVMRDGAELAAVAADRPLAIGSAFKLLILQALQAQIESGEHAWDEVVPLQAEYRSLPSGRLQDWPVGSPMTVQTLATMMISESDNTATDHLLALVGRDAVEALTPRNRPFLSTREFFSLKDPQNQALLRRYRDGSERERRGVLGEIATLPLPSVNIFNNGPVALDVEWFLSARELCRTIATVADLPSMQVNPGLVDPNHWQRVAFKGGSEPGVINFTTDLLADDGHRYCIAATWNNPEGVDEIEFSTLYRSAVAAMRSQ